jgi:hypothetical protein
VFISNHESIFMVRKLNRCTCTKYILSLMINIKLPSYCFISQLKGSQKHVNGTIDIALSVNNPGRWCKPFLWPSLNHSTSIGFDNRTQGDKDLSLSNPVSAATCLVIVIMAALSSDVKHSNFQSQQDNHVLRHTLKPLSHIIQGIGRWHCCYVLYSTA